MASIGSPLSDIPQSPDSSQNTADSHILHEAVMKARTEQDEILEKTLQPYSAKGLRTVEVARLAVLEAENAWIQAGGKLGV